LKGTSLFSHYWRVLAHATPGPWISLSHVKSHRGPDDAISEQDRFRILGNRMADTLAKEAAGKHVPDPTTRLDTTLALEEFLELVVGAGRVLASWLPSREYFGPLSEVPRSPPPHPFCLLPHPHLDRQRLSLHHVLKSHRPHCRRQCSQEYPQSLTDAINQRRALHHSPHTGWIDGSRMPIYLLHSLRGLQHGEGHQALPALSP